MNGSGLDEGEVASLGREVGWKDAFRILRREGIIFDQYLLGEEIARGLS